MAERPTTIYDVARAAGVAPSTVSRAFSRPGRVNAETAERIREVAAELGYRANPQARALSTRSTSMIAVLLADIANPVFAELVRGAEEAAAEAGYAMVLADTRESAGREREVLDKILPTVDGIVLASPRMSDTAVRQVAKVKPTVVLNREVGGLPSVVVDNPRGMRRAAEHLAALGHTQVTYLAGPEAAWPDGVRWRALRDARTDLGLTVRRVGPVPPTVNGGVRAAAAWATHPTSAVVAYNDMVAIGFMRGALAMGRRVPGDVSVIGFDNTQSAEIVTPGLTTVAAPQRELGARAVRHVLAFVGGARSTSTDPLVLPSKLVERASTGPYPAPS
ncbi:LacI family DNA-binding transcriptional regulator [Pseudactinotalea terrae]|uniref:LacI family DNA-binding transcriptional regulator n=1 Tax=Pseudactinotalea terrae TaxID=1743262 RepID=UPI0012E120EB|nr:LacI family DNA-binding transcriptional regulator [Pseudactinotalea terrae]